ncbi:MAG TPA: hypothetical protein VMO78_07150 [Rhizomicrobium sp.]|nr:hypothetical protein [Rhizomicrobium sp.]
MKRPIGSRDFWISASNSDAIHNRFEQAALARAQQDHHKQANGWAQEIDDIICAFPFSKFQEEFQGPSKVPLCFSEFLVGCGRNHVAGAEYLQHSHCDAPMGLRLDPIVGWPSKRPSGSLENGKRRFHGFRRVFDGNRSGVCRGKQQDREPIPRDLD